MKPVYWESLECDCALASLSPSLLNSLHLSLEWGRIWETSAFSSRWIQLLLFWQKTKGNMQSILGPTLHCRFYFVFVMARTLNNEHVFCISLLCLSKCDDDTATGSKINMFSCCLHEQITFRKKWLQKQFVKLVRDISWPWILALLLLLLLLLFFLNSAKVFMFITPRDCDDRSLVTQTCLWGLWPHPPSIIENSFWVALLSSSQ